MFTDRAHSYALLLNFALYLYSLYTHYPKLLQFIPAEVWNVSIRLRLDYITGYDIWPLSAVLFYGGRVFCWWSYGKLNYDWYKFRRISKDIWLHSGQENLSLSADSSTLDPANYFTVKRNDLHQEILWNATLGRRLYLYAGVRKSWVLKGMDNSLKWVTDEVIMLGERSR